MSSYVDRIRPDSYGITTYLENLRRGAYQIPTFQREVVWDRDRVKKLWDSIYRFYPLGSILVWLTDTRLQNSRAIGGHPLQDTSSQREFQYLLDGQQRTTALLTSIYGWGPSARPWDVRDPRIYVDLHVHGSEEAEDETWRNRFLFWDEIDDRGGELLRNAGRKKSFDNGTIVTLEDIAHRYQDLEERLNKIGLRYQDVPFENLRRFKRVLDNYKLSFIELRGIAVAEVCQIFERINQAGQPLSMFDIVVAKTFRAKTDTRRGFYLRELIHDFKRDLAGSRYALLDDMTLLQMLAVLVREDRPDDGIHNITDTYLNLLKTEQLEAVWDRAQMTFRRVFEFLDNRLHLPGPALIPYRYLYMSLATYLWNNEDPDYDMLRRYFWYFAFHNDDLLSNTTHLRDHITRLNKAKQGQGFGFARFLIDRERLRGATYSTQGRLSRAILALYANQQPRDWKDPERSVLTSVYYTLTDHPNLHHIFPLDLCAKHVVAPGKHADSLLNIAYLTQIENLRISNRNPIEYLRDYVGEAFRPAQDTHLLPDILLKWVEAEELPAGAFDSFVEGRLDLLLGRLCSQLKGISFEVIDTRAKVEA